ncbi:MAG: SOS response-associated peptidase [Bacteroidota bacterium]
MCGRYAVVSKLKIIEREFQVDVSEVLDRFTLSPNISPGENALVITNKDPEKVQMFQFGFTPFWAKKKMYVINARSEGDHNKENDPKYNGAKGIVSKPMFRKAIRSQRCLVIADAFIEGTTTKKLSEPYLVYRGGKKRPFAMAGVWDEWIDKQTGEVTSSFAILTTPPNGLLQKIPHHRSPLILPKEDEQKWISNDTPLEEVTAMMRPFDDSDFNAYPISIGIKSPRNKDFELLKPEGERLKKEYDYIFYQDLELQGMGETTARKRKQSDQLDLFEDQ